VHHPRDERPPHPCIIGRPDLFWDASCGPCNYAGGRSVAAANTKATIARVQQIVEEQDQRIEHPLDRLAQLERADQPQPRREPAIY
jgi:hypothetical protein